MRTEYTFKSKAFRPVPAELNEEHEDFINSGIFARELADFLKSGLRHQGYNVKFACPEDWGIWQEIEHSGGYTLAVGCSNIAVDEEGLTKHRVFAVPSHPTIRIARNWFRKTDVTSDIGALVAAIGEILRATPHIRDIAGNEAQGAGQRTPSETK